MSKNKSVKEKNNISDFFLSEDENEKNGFDDPDYISYDELEEAEVIIIPIEDTSEEYSKQKKSFEFKIDFSVKDIEGIIKALIVFLTALGESASSIIKSVLVSVFNLIKIPAVFIWQKVILNLSHRLKTKASRSAKKINLHDYRKFREDAKQAIQNLQEKDNLHERRKAFRKNVSLSFTKHRRVWLTAFNIIFPVICFFALITTINHYRNLTYALSVEYNGENIGYIKNEDVFSNAKDRALERLSSGTSDKVNISVPTYRIAMLTPDKLSDSKTMCDRIIENTDGNFINACGIYIDGEFICAVKNETDAVNVFDKILEPYQKKAGKEGTVAFVQEIKYVQGFYSDNENVIWTSDKLEDEMNSTKSGAVYYTVKDGDSPSGIASAHKMYLSDLVKLNPSLADGSIHVGEKILLSAQVNNIRVKVMKTETRTVELPFESETKESAALYKGTSKTVQEGRKGEQKITELVTYIDGVKTYSTLVSTKTTKYPIKEIIYKGTKEVIQTPTRPSTQNGGSNGGSYTGGYNNYLPGNPSATGTSFGSPMASSYYFSSGYGGRTLYGRYNFHRGVDLCHAGGSGGIPVLSVQSGTVVAVSKSNSGYGHSVLIRHSNGIQTRYAHMQAGSISVRVGQTVSKGQQIGRVGATGNATGNHLHFEVIKNGANVNPTPYLR